MVNSMESLPSAIDLSHHLTEVARSRHPSPLKDIISYMSRPGMISLAGGLPHPSLFPFTALQAAAYPSSTVLDTASPAVPHQSVKLEIPYGASTSSPYSLTSLLQYSAPPGHLALLQFTKELTKKLHSPAYINYVTLLNNGSTDGWNKLCTLLLERGDYILVEEQIYPSAQAAFIPLGVRSAVVGVDGEGARPDLLEAILASWDASKGRRPHVMYIVPVGQNPLGSTMKSERRKQIYDICVKYDVIIIEDDPYTMLQFGDYELGKPSTPAAVSCDVEEFVGGIEKSFMSIDYQGRVIRLETFSKTISPGARLGWFVCNEMFAERLLRGTEVQTQHPSGFSQMIVGELLNQWGMSGYLQWTANLKEQYRVRRDWLLNALADEFDLIPAHLSDVKGALGLVALSKTNGKPLLSFVPPSAGMFLWCDVNYASNQEFQNLVLSSQDPEGDFEHAFWERLAAANVLVTPGWYYRPWMGEEFRTVKSRGGRPGMGHFRLAFSLEGKEQILEGVRRLAEVMHREWA
ncbi:pyridoxal phosphate-dependent transferase [Naematelia encephala]|uniref:Pyridoxal phosphate-dependent transferase n=1 Tax=Naematelia encephala TaxID=71784 RepID=A0A1Y2AMF1_9TREE|nr:pyridoxal phosphate-dependent transferase [Naematelia encephala]